MSRSAQAERPSDSRSPSAGGQSPWPVRLRAAAAGVGAWVVGYVVSIGFSQVLGVTEGAGSLPDAGNFSFGEIAGPTGSEVVWKLGGTVFYAAHFVPAELGLNVSGSGELGSFGGSLSIGFNLIPNVVPQEGPQWLALLAVPPLALTGAGYLAARWSGVGPASAVRTGAAVVLGYLPLSVGGIVLFGLTYTATVADYGQVSVSFGPELLLGVVLAGLVYPLSFGALGGYLWRRRQPDAGGSRGQTAGRRPPGR